MTNGKGKGIKDKKVEDIMTKVVKLDLDPSCKDKVKGAMIEHKDENTIKACNYCWAAPDSSMF
ncbi:MAG: hypothetical protein R6U26_00930 [Candidatus Undinarchaeales archaeon]